MKIIVVLALVGFACALLTGCAGFVQAPVVPPFAFVYTHYGAPLDVDLQNTSINGKRGVASTQNILGIVAFGDASIKAAADDGRITTVEHVDYEFLNVLWVFSKFTTIVYGQ